MRDTEGQAAEAACSEVGVTNSSDVGPNTAEAAAAGASASATWAINRRPARPVRWDWL